MEEKHAAADTAAVGAGDQDDAQAAAAALDGVQYCSEHPYRPGSAAAAAAVAGGGICAFCLQEKLGRLVSSSKSSPFFPLGGHPPPSGSPSSPPSFRRAAAEHPPPPPVHPSAAARRFMSFHRKKTSSSSSSSSSSASAAALSGGGLKRSKSVAPRPEEQFPYSSSMAAESPRKKSFWSFLYLSSSPAYAHQASAAPYAGAAAARRKSVSVASAAWASRASNAGGAQVDQQPRAAAATLEAIGEPAESPSQSQVSSSSSFGRKVARSRSVGCGSRSFSGDFLERISNGFGDCTLRRVESHREPKPHKMRGGAGPDDDGDEDDDDDVFEHQHRIKCAGFFGGLGPASSYWLSAAEGATGGGGARKSGGRSHRSWAWALASPMRAFRPAASATSTKTITVVPPSHVMTSNGNTSASALSISSPTPPSSEAAPTAAQLAAATAAN
ncbi:unnamed protein product [Urochloa decumbens]|uniref:Uncharacterized protein n=1 Tax=Urochloa decumbens TaxID=240449 RepID=A0ABC9CJ27_9POAL